MTSTQVVQFSPSGQLSDHFIQYQKDSHTLRNESQKHPLGVKPSGNALASEKNLFSALGTLAMLPDSMILLVLEYLDETSLTNIGATCRALFAFSVYDQLWRDIAISTLDDNFRWLGSWRASRKQVPVAKLAHVDCRYLYSDALYRPFQCSQLSLESYVTNIPKSNQISRLQDLNNDEFNGTWTDKPFVLTKPVKTWKIYKEWDEHRLLQKYANVRFRAEAVDWPLRTYIEYMNNNNDESPLYLFDRSFAEKMDLTVGEGEAYKPPDCFTEDLFTLLGDKRPDHRWLIIGPERSGSTFHKDPNATSAWNAVIRGSKYWIMFPNSIIPPGVYMSEDQSEVTSPLSIAEWLLSFHDEARNTIGCVEGICHEGEVLHVPSGWWHLVVNLEPAIAITQNFVPRSHLQAATHFLQYKADQVSGFKNDVLDPHALFMEKLQHADPDLFDVLHASKNKKRKWEDLVAASEDVNSKEGGFSFGFGDDLDSDDG